MRDRLEGRPHVGEEFADLLRAVRQSPFGEVHLRVFGEQVQAIGEAIGRSLRFEQVAPDEAVQELFAGMPTGFAKSIVDAHAEMVRHPEPVTSTVLDITGSQARTFAQWAADHAADFTR